MFRPFRRQPSQLILAWLCISVLISRSSPAVASQSVTVSLYSGSDSPFVSYNIYYGTVSHDYVNQITVGNTNVATITDLADGVTYYFVATGVDGLGNESAYSDEVSFTTAVPVAATLTPVPVPAGLIGFSVSGGSVPVYVVQTSTDLVNWVSVQLYTAPFTYTDACLPDVPQRFYRVLCPTP
jgi:hypothetical protein